MPETYNEQNQLILSLLCIAALVTSAILYAKIGTSDGYLDEKNSTDNSVLSAESGIESPAENLLNEDNKFIVNITKPKVHIKPQPSCPPQDKYLELTTLCEEFVFASFTCRPEDVMNPVKHKIPKYYYHHHVRNNSNNDTQNTIVNCIIAVLLLTSLGAALLEFYRAKISPSPENEKKGAKAPLNRKCSLADLTVLKHHRKELVRRESILEHHFEEEGDFQHHQDLKPFPLQRRCSFPVSLPSNDASLVEGSFPMRRNSRNFSIAGDINRKMSIVNDGSRKLSMVSDENLWRRGSIVGEDSSPERRVHHSRLVHRH